MTLVVWIVLGTGLLLFVSALENSSIVKTFQAIWGRQPLASVQNTGQGAPAAKT